MDTKDFLIAESLVKRLFARILLKKWYLCRKFLMYIIMVIAFNQCFAAGVPYKNGLAGKAQMSEVRCLLLRIYHQYGRICASVLRIYMSYRQVWRQGDGQRSENLKVK
jgi:hypothetical protein